MPKKNEEVRTMRGGDLLEGFVGKRGVQKLADVHAEMEAREAARMHVEPPRRPSALADPLGRDLALAVEGVVQRANALFDSGLTNEALVLLITAKCPADKNSNPTSAASVERVLKGIKRLGEYLDGGE